MKYTTVDMHNQLKGRFEKFSELEYLNKLNYYYLPMLKEHAGKINLHLAEITNMKEVIRHFDEAICIKANKADFELMRQEFEDKYVMTVKWNDLVHDTEKLQS